MKIIKVLLPPEEYPRWVGEPRLESKLTSFLGIVEGVEIQPISWDGELESIPAEGLVLILYQPQRWQIKDLLVSHCILFDETQVYDLRSGNVKKIHGESKIAEFVLNLLEEY